MYTKQQTFNIVARHLLGMEQRSISTEGDCAYRGSDGAQCAIGCLIPDEQYATGMEGITAKGLARVLRLLGHDVDLCLDLQTVHDHYFFETERSPGKEFALECVALKHELRMVDV